MVVIFIKNIISIPVGRAKNLIGERFGKLIVISRAPSKTKSVMWNCQCDCGNYIVTYGNMLKCGDIKKCNECSCCTFYFKNDYVIGKTTSDKEFYFDLIDYNLLKSYSWYLDKDGYVATFISKKMILMHRLIMKQIENINDYDIDHINEVKYDNRRKNLRKATRQENKRNVSAIITNTTGFRGVYKIKYNGIETGRYYVRIKSTKNKILHLGCFDSLEEAIKIRKEAELKYYGKFSPLYNN